MLAHLTVISSYCAGFALLLSSQLGRLRLWFTHIGAYSAHTQQERKLTQTMHQHALRRYSALFSDTGAIGWRETFTRGPVRAWYMNLPAVTPSRSTWAPTA